MIFGNGKSHRWHERHESKAPERKEHNAANIGRLFQPKEGKTAFYRDGDQNTPAGMAVRGMMGTPLEKGKGTKQFNIPKAKIQTFKVKFKV